jgi:inner membrane protein
LASAISHAIASLGVAACFYRPSIPNRVWSVGAVCTVFPDVDVIGFHYGIPYGDFWGHRGFTHSLIFAAILASAVLLVLFRQSVAGLSRSTLWVFLFLATASHGLLDAMTDGGLGVAFFSPFQNSRCFFPWTPIRVSPIGVTRFFSTRGWEVLKSELVWVWLPTSCIIAAALFVRSRRPSLLT